MEKILQTQKNIRNYQTVISNKESSISHPADDGFVLIKKKNYIKEWKKNNPDKIKKYAKNEWIKNKEKLTEKHKKYNIKNKEKTKIRSKKYNTINKEHLKKKQSEWKKRNRKKLREYAARYKKKYPEKAEIKNFKSKLSSLKINFTFEEYKKLVSEQNNLCAICNKKEEKRSLSIDHSHVTLKVRGLLCKKCNSGLGFFGDNIFVIEKALKYLKKNE